MATQTENINLNINVNNTDSSMKSVKQMKDEIRNLTAAMGEAAAAGDKATFDKLKGTIGRLKNDIADLNVTMKASDPGELLNNFVKMGQGVVGSFAAITGAMSLFGSESEKVKEIEKKAATIIQTMIGLEQFRATFIDQLGKARIKQSFIELSAGAKEISQSITKAIVIKAETTATGQLTAAQRIYNLVVAQNPIVWMIAAVAALTAGILYLTGAFDDNSDAVAKSQLDYKALDEMVSKTHKDLLRSKLNLDLQLGKISKLDHDRAILFEEQKAEAIKRIMGQTLEYQRLLNKYNLDSIGKNAEETYKLWQTYSADKSKLDKKYAEVNKEAQQNFVDEILQLTLKSNAETTAANKEKNKKQIEDNKAATAKKVEEAKKTRDLETQAIQSDYLKQKQLALDKYNDDIKAANGNKKQIEAINIAYAAKQKEIDDKNLKDVQTANKDSDDKIYEIYKTGRDARIEAMKEGIDKETELRLAKFEDETKDLDSTSQVYIDMETRLRNDLDKIKKDGNKKIIEDNKALFDELNSLHVNNAAEDEAAAIKKVKDEEERLVALAKATGQTEETIKQIHQDAEDQITDIKKAALEKRKKEMMEAFDNIKEFNDTLKSAEQEAAAQEYSDKQATLDAQQQDEVDKVTKEWDAKINAAKAAGQNITELEKQKNDALSNLTRDQNKADADLKEEKEKKDKEIKKKYAGIDYAMTMAKIGMNIAEAITKEWSQMGVWAVIANVATIAIGVAQAAAATAQYQNIMKLAQGGILNGPSHSMGGIPIGNGQEVEGGEGVINKKSMMNPVLRQMASNINVAGGGIPFAGTNNSSPISASIDVNVIESIVQQVTNRIASIPVVVVESDITQTQRKVRVIENKVQF